MCSEVKVNRWVVRGSMWEKAGITTLQSNISKRKISRLFDTSCSKASRKDKKRRTGPEVTESERKKLNELLIDRYNRRSCKGRRKRGLNHQQTNYTWEQCCALLFYIKFELSVVDGGNDFSWVGSSNLGILCSRFLWSCWPLPGATASETATP